MRESEKTVTTGRECASKKKKEYTPTTTTMTTNSKAQQQSASRLSQGQNIILRDSSRGLNREAGDDDSGVPDNRQGRKAALSKTVSRWTKQTSKTNSAKLRGRSKKR